MTERNRELFHLVADDPEELMPEASFYPLSREPTYYSHPTATTNP